MATFQVRKHGGCQARVRLKGHDECKVFYDSGRKTARQLAEAWADELEDRIAGGGYKSTKRAQWTTLLDALVNYDEQVAKTHKGYPAEKRRIEAWKKWKYIKTNLTDLTPEMFDSYRDDRRKWVSDGTIRLDLAVIAGIFKHGKFGIQNPAKETASTLGQNKKRSRRLSAEEEEYLFEALNNTDCSDKTRINRFLPLVATFALETGCRMSEIVKDSREHTTGVLRENLNIDGTKSTAFITNTKNGADRHVPLTPIAVSAIQEAMSIKKGGKGPVFATTVSAINQAWNRAKKRAIEKYKKDGGQDPNFLLDLHFHDLRHEAASRWKKHFNLPQLKDLTGHKDIRSLMRYVHSDQDDIAEMAAKMAEIQSLKLPAAPKEKK